MKIHRAGAGDEGGRKRCASGGIRVSCATFLGLVVWDLPTMTNPNARSGWQFWRRRFSNCCACSQAMTLQPSNTQAPVARRPERPSLLKAFEYLPVDIARKPVRCQACPVQSTTSSRRRIANHMNGSPVYKIAIPDADAWVVGTAAQSWRDDFRQNCFERNLPAPPRGATVNPWNQNTRRGGSSSVRAAVAGSIVRLALGTQTLGSIIRPAGVQRCRGLSPVSARSLAPACTP